MRWNRLDPLQIQIYEKEDPAVTRAANCLRQDLIRTLDAHVNTYKKPKGEIFVGTIEGLSKLCEENSEKAWIRPVLKEAEEAVTRGGIRIREAFWIREWKNTLFIVGSDRRGAIYGIYDLSEMLGVSPWVFFADVPPRRRDYFALPENYEKLDYPTVEYRGIFINDEEELEHWVWRYMGEKTIGVKTYEMIFELLLRLKLNYLWPAMHVNSFNMDPESGKLASRMGIVIGSTHCDMLMRSNNREWYPWLKKKGYTDIEYDFSIPGKNREALKEYWRESVQQNKDLEVSYTLGMRGIHDSGFETKTLQGLSGEALQNARIELLSSVIDAQEDILKEEMDSTPLKIFVPYKEVLPLYDNGLQVPEDLTLIWTNDNYGNVRRYPNAEEQKRVGGNGLYFHYSYWAPPGASYLFIASLPLSHTRSELMKAYANGIRRLWVTNFGAIKPLEEQLTYYARICWEAGRLFEKEEAERENRKPVLDPRIPLTCIESEETFLADWIDSMFHGNFGAAFSKWLLRFDQVTNTVKLEHMQENLFDQSRYGDEAVGRLHFYEEIFNLGNRIYQSLPLQERDAFFELFLMKIHAAYFTNAMYYYADRSAICMERGNTAAAREYTDRSQAFDLARRQMLYYYNHVLCDGKWNGILTPEDFPPPRCAMYPAAVCTSSGLEGCDLTQEEIPDFPFSVTLKGEKEVLTFADSSRQWMDLGLLGSEPVSFCIKGPSYVQVDEQEGFLTSELRIPVSIDFPKLFEGLGIRKQEELDRFLKENPDTKITEKLLISAPEKTYEVLIQVDLSLFAFGLLDLKGDWRNGRIRGDVDGRICLEADFAEPFDTEKGGSGWEKIGYLGRGRGCILQAVKKEAVCSFSFALRREGAHILEIHRTPSLNSVGRLRLGIRVDGGEPIIVESFANDEHRSTWKRNILTYADKLRICLPFLKTGMHRIEVLAIDLYVAFSRMVIYTEPIRKNALGYCENDWRLPLPFDTEGFVKEMYGSNALDPRPVMTRYRHPQGDAVNEEEEIAVSQINAMRDPAAWKDYQTRPGKEQDGTISIPMAAAFFQSDFASFKQAEDGYFLPWMGEDILQTRDTKLSLCVTPRHENKGRAVLVREPGILFEKGPKLTFKVDCKGGSYCFWMLLYVWDSEACRFDLMIDGQVIPQEKFYEGSSVWRYSLEHVYQWIPIWTQELTAGEHEITVHIKASALRLEELLLVRE